ncbi:MAG: hypothetical protein QOE86_3783 [Solirubrobacteraceae bacterium]|jgi:hypothetical protein|nr:hypothetical protein [Solirubrobacteraceae bacterium]
MAPELVELGDRLEAAANRSVARRRGRRQLALNAAASLIVAVPITVTVATTQFTTTAVPVTRVSPAPTASGSLVPQVLPSGLANRDLITDEEDAPSSAEFLPRDLHRLRLTPQSELLLLPSSLRPALR